MNNARLLPRAVFRINSEFFLNFFPFVDFFQGKNYIFLRICTDHSVIIRSATQTEFYTFILF